jgi:hypothetical protein
MQTCRDEVARDALVSQLKESPYLEMIRKAVLDVVFTTIAASELPTDDAFRQLVDMLKVGESDDLVRQIKKVFVETMLDDHNFGDDLDDQSVKARMDYVLEQIDVG